MEVLLIVYAVSWLILFLLYVSFELNEKSDKQTKATWGFKLFCMTVFTFLAPIVVLAIPCICVYDFCRKKKMKEEFEKRNKSAEKVMQQLNNDAKRRSGTAAKRYRIAFKELPFLPDERQVIYVENAYDEKVNCL